MWVAELGGRPVWRPDQRSTVAEMVLRMRRLIRDGAIDPRVYVEARRAVQVCGENDRSCEVKRLHRFVRSRVRYVRDPRHVDVVAPAARTLEIGAGDCDDLTVVFGALAQSVGYPVRFVLGTFDRSNPDPTHVLPGIGLEDGGVLPVELSGSWPVGRLGPGFEVRRIEVV